MISEELENKIKENARDFMDALEIVKEVKAEVAKARAENANELVAGMLPAIKEEAQADAVIRVRAEYNIVTGRTILELSPFTSESKPSTDISSFQKALSLIDRLMIQSAKIQGYTLTIIMPDGL